MHLPALVLGADPEGAAPAVFPQAQEPDCLVVVGTLGQSEFVVEQLHGVGWLGVSGGLGAGGGGAGGGKGAALTEGGLSEVVYFGRLNGY